MCDDSSFIVTIRTVVRTREWKPMKSISIDVIALMNTDYLKAKFKNRNSLSRT